MTPVVASSTSSVSCGAPGTSRAAMRRILAARPSGSSSCEAGRPCPRGGIGRPRAFAAESASNRTAEGSAPSRWRTTGSSRRSAHVWSCSIAPARNVSAAASSTRRPAAFSRAASFAVVVVLPEPLTPTRKVTNSGTSGRRAGRGADAISFSISSSSISRSAARSLRSAPPGSRSYGLGQGAGRLRADVRGEERLLERLEHRLVEPETLLDRRSELLEDLGVRHEEAAAHLREEAAARARSGGASSDVRRPWRRGKIPQERPGHAAGLRSLERLVLEQQTRLGAGVPGGIELDGSLQVSPAQFGLLHA